MAQQAMFDRERTRFDQTPWCAKLLADPDWIHIPTRSRVPRTTPGDDFFRDTLGTEKTIPECLTQIRTPDSTLDPSLLNLYSTETSTWLFAIREIRTFFLLRPGLNGYPGITHGGLVASLLDEVMGFLLTANKDYHVQQTSSTSATTPPRLNTVTGELTVKYRQPVLTKDAVLVRAWFGENDGRRIKVLASLEDAEGRVLSDGIGTFVALKPGGGSAFAKVIKGKM